MRFLELLVQKYSHHTHKLTQIHALLITTGFFLLRFSSNSKPTWKVSPSSFLFNSLIKAHLRLGNPPNAALHLFTQMLAHLTQPNHHTFPSLLKAAASSPPAALSIHAQIIRRGLLLDDFTNCCVVDLYSRLGSLSDARKTFDEIPHPDVVSSNSMLNAFCIKGDLPSALRLFETLPVRDIISWTTLINGFIVNGRSQEAIEMFRSLIHDQQPQVIRPNEATLVSVLSACANLDGIGGGLHRGREIHACIMRNETQMTAFLGTALIDMYGKHGLSGYSSIVFNVIPRKEVCTWNAMISALAGNGKETEALDLFDEMREEGRLRPNHITFVSVLTACARGRLVELGLRWFETMSSDYAIVPTMEHYGCIVDLLSREGRFREAREFVGRMPIEPNASVWGALLGGCKVHGNATLGAEVGRQLVGLQPWHSGRYMVLSNIYAESGRWDAAEELRDGMKKAGVKKIVGYSWLDSRNSIL